MWRNELELDTGVVLATLIPRYPYNQSSCFSALRGFSTLVRGRLFVQQLPQRLLSLGNIYENLIEIFCNEKFWLEKTEKKYFGNANAPYVCQKVEGITLSERFN